MTDPNAQMKVDPAEVRAHGQRLDEVTGHVRVAHDASDVALPSDAFGTFGTFHAQVIGQVAAEGVKMLAAANTSAAEHRANVGKWADDVDAREGEIMALFWNGPEMRNA